MLFLMNDLLAAIPSAQILATTLLAILFLQSGLDKVIDWKGNLEWLIGHFSKSPLKNQVPILLGTVTIVEIAAGIACAIGAVMLLLTGDRFFALIGTQLSALSIVLLFFGQRIAKDYDGAAGLTGYFAICLITLWLLSV